MAIADETLTLHGRRPPAQVPVSHVYFPFASGQWTYDCASCGARCCRGYGYSLGSAQEWSTHLRRRPSVHLFVSPPSRGPVAPLTVRNFRPGCVMLTGRGQCDVQLADGYASKPETCRLFPFNLFTYVDGYLVVAPHPSLCPLGLSASPARCSTHDTLLAALQERGVFAPVPEHVCASGDAAAAIEVERAVVGSCSLLTPRPSYEDLVLAQFEAAGGETGLAAAPLGTPAHLAEYSRHLRTTLGTWPGQVHDRHPDLLCVVIAATPAVRSRFLFGVGTDPWKPHLARRLPYLLLTLQKILALLHEAGMATVSYQTVMAVVDSYRSFLTVAALLDCEITWAPGSRARLLMPAGEPELAQNAYLLVAQAVSGASPHRCLGEVLGQACSAADVGRLALLESISSMLLGRIVPRDLHTARFTMKPSLRQWALKRASPEVLFALARSCRRERTPRSLTSSTTMRWSARERHRAGRS